MRSRPAFCILHSAFCILLLLAPSAAFALAPEECTFHAAFDGTLDASQAGGSGKAAPKGEMPFVPGIRGQGILVGAPGSALAYETGGNVSLEAGSVSVWIKPQTWDDDDAAMRFFFALNEADPNTPRDGGTFLWLYRFFSRTTYFLAWDPRGYPTLVAADSKQFPKLFEKGQWVHLVGTWNGDEMRLFLNGKPQGSCRVATAQILRTLGKTFTVGGENRANAADTVLDELRLFNRALTTPEVEALYRFEFTAASAPLEATAVRLPTANKVRVDINAIGHRPSEAGRLSGRVVVTPAGEDRTVAEAKVARFEVQHATAEFTTAKMPPGEYRAVVHLMANAQEIGTAAAPFSVRPAPAWLGAPAGLAPDKVPAPWTPIRVSSGRVGERESGRKGDGGRSAVTHSPTPPLSHSPTLPRAIELQCWGPRRYRVGDALFPTGLATPACEMLAGPIRLVGTVNGVPLERLAVKTTLGEQSPARVEVSNAGKQGGLQASTRQFLEFDGLFWTRLRLDGGRRLKVERLALEIPLKREAATLMQTGFSWEDAGAVRKWSHRVLANTQIWLGNEEGGVQWTVPSARNWRSADRARQVEIVPDGESVLLRLNLVDQATTFEGPIEYEFGAQLTPVRPYPKGWRMWRITPAQDTPGTRFIPFYTEGWAVGTSYPIPRDRWEKIYTDETKKGNIATLYLQPFSVWQGMPDYADFAAEWRTRLHSAPPPPDPNAPPMTFMGVCPRAHSWSDYFVNTFCDLTQGKYKEMGWGAVYFDNTMTAACDNADHGCGYRDEHGVWQGEQRFLEHREVQKRFYMAMQERWPARMLFNHESGHLNMMQLAFTHGMIDGEHLTLMLPGKAFNYHDILTLDRMRAEYMGRNFGFVPIFLPEFTRAGHGNAEKVRHFFGSLEPPEVMHLAGLLFLHDVLPWNAYAQPAPYYHWWAVQDAFGWGDDVEFLPYWKNREMVTLSPADPNVVCSLYRRPGKVLAVLMNNTDAEREVTLALNPEKLGLPAGTGSALDAWKSTGYKTPDYVFDDKGQPRAAPQPRVVAGTEERLPLESGRLTVKVGARNFRVLVME